MTEIHSMRLQNLSKNISHKSKTHRKQSGIFLCWILVILLLKCCFDGQASLSVSKAHGVEVFQLCLVVT